MNSNDLIPGSYWQHFKGGEYCIFGLAHNALSGEDLVIYRSAAALMTPAPTGSLQACPVESFSFTDKIASLHLARHTETDEDLVIYLLARPSSAAKKIPVHETEDLSHIYWARPFQDFIGIHPRGIKRFTLTANAPREIN